MNRLLTGMFAVVTAFFILSGCKEEKHPEAEQLAELLKEEIHFYETAGVDCQQAKNKLLAFYTNPDRYERAAQAAIGIIYKYFNKDEEYLGASVRLIKPSYSRLDGAIFDFNSKCNIKPDFIETIKMSSGQKIKQVIDTKDAGAVSRMYQMEGELREFVQVGLNVRDPEVEGRLSKLERHRERKEAKKKLSKGIGAMKKMFNTANKLLPKGKAKR